MFDKINEFICNSYVNEVDSKKDRSIDTFYPSQASCVNLLTGKIEGTCARALYYDFTKAQLTNPPSPSSIRKMKYGNKIEDYEVECLKGMNICVSTQTSFEKIYETIKIRGKVDAIIEYEDLFNDKEYVCLEYKSSGGYYFKNLVFGTAKVNGFPKISNLMQAMIYVDAFKNHETFKFNKCYLMYIDRESCNNKSFKIELTDEGFPKIDGDEFKALNIKSIYERYKYLNKHLILNILPKRDFRPEIDIATCEQENEQGIISDSMLRNFKQYGKGIDVMCQFCNYKNLCIKEGK